MRTQRTSAQRRADMSRYRRKLRARVLAVYHGVCMWDGCGSSRRLNLAHRFPVGRDTTRAFDGWTTLYQARDHPFLFLLLCRRHHRALDGPTWGVKRGELGRLVPTHTVSAGYGGPIRGR